MTYDETSRAPVYNRATGEVKYVEADDVQAHKAPLLAPYAEFTRLRQGVSLGLQTVSGAEYGTVDALERFCVWLEKKGWA